MNAESNPKSKRRVKTVGTVFDIIETLLELEEASFTEIAENVDLAQSTVYDYLVTLEEKEIIAKDNGQYRVGLTMLQMGGAVRANHKLHEAAQLPIEALAEESGETVWIFTEEHGYAINLLKALGDDAIQTYGQVGKRTLLHQLAAGKVIFAHISSRRQERIIEKHGLPQSTPNTITDRNVLEEELDRIRNRGYAFNDEEIIPGVRAVAAPIFDDGQILGSVCVCGPAKRFTRDRFEETLPDLTLACANEIELKLEY